MWYMITFGVEKPHFDFKKFTVYIGKRGRWSAMAKEVQRAWRWAGLGSSVKVDVGRGQNTLLLLAVFSQFSGNSSWTLKTNMTEATLKWSRAAIPKELPCEPDASHLWGVNTGPNNLQRPCVCKDSKEATVVPTTRMATGLKMKHMVQH